MFASMNKSLTVAFLQPHAAVAVHPSPFYRIAETERMSRHYYDLYVSSMNRSLPLNEKALIQKSHSTCYN